jgi:hypothetical protein
MAKRKAESSEEGLLVAPNRRSSRRKTSDEDELIVSKKTTASNRAQNAKKPPKSSKGSISKTKTVKEEDANASQVTHLFLRSYSHLEALFISSCLSVVTSSTHHVISYPQQCRSYSCSIIMQAFLLMLLWTLHVFFY